MSEQTETTENAESTAGGMTAKTISKIFKIVSAAGVIACAVAKWTGALLHADAGEICMIWLCVYGIGAGTIDINIMFDKFTGGRK